MPWASLEIAQFYGRILAQIFLFSCRLLSQKKTSDYPPYDSSFFALADDARARTTSSVFEDAVSPMDMVEVNSDAGGGTPPYSPRNSDAGGTPPYSPRDL